MDKASTELVMEIQEILFHLHSMGMLLVSHHTELIDSEKLKPDLDDSSEPILTIADIIQEKSKICLDKLGIIEAHFREAEKH